ncbi:hypothetical protein O3G_MSEX003724 [Manduca sexta]|uniref:Peptidase M14 domain-containing protein n=1 Tax=Manduca sexta TaxID=7130 RepID=A0A922CFH6_MANSE|nr:hypothetical protein O3G_MSEX003724 [Manduca sexta]KAG6445085.1 hypothetical protein O3G_MSEX003724 [Manduca sexta]
MGSIIFIVFGLVVLRVIATPFPKKVSYAGAQIWRTALRTPNDILLIKKLFENQDISIWNLSPKRADFLVLEDNKVKIHRQLSSRGLNHTVLILDVQRRVDALKTEPVLWDDNTLRQGHRLTWNRYPTLRIIEEYFNYVADTYPSICKLEKIGSSSENRSITMVGVSNGNPNNMGILVLSGLHAREWIGITSALYILNNIVTKFDQQPEYIKNKNWYFIPLLNPDGYEYSQTVNRLWRKNRRKFKRCYGVDINRNFGKDWAIDGITENHECKDAYAGPFAFSEPESAALRDVVTKAKGKLDALIDIHSYGQLILYPWSARPWHNPDMKVQKNAAEAMTQAIFDSTKNLYKSGETYHMVYPATGSALDWIYASGVTHAFAIETRDTGEHGFLISPHYIEPTGKELFIAVKQLAKVLGPKFVSRGKDYQAWF